MESGANDSTELQTNENEIIKKCDETIVVGDQGSNLTTNPKGNRPKELVHKCASDPSASTSGQTSDLTLLNNDRRLYYRERRNRHCRDRETGKDSPEESSGRNLHMNDDDDNDEGGDYDNDDDIEQLESPSQNALCPKGLFTRSVRHPSSGAMTRKCVLTLDGYSYVIVASTPENRAVRDEIVAGAVDRLTADRRNSNSPTSSTQSSIPINGQVSKQGSLTIVRRSNSRKGNLCQPDSQFLLQSPSQQQQSTSIGFTQDPLGSSNSQQVFAAITPSSDTTTACGLSSNSKLDCSNAIVSWTIDQNEREERLAGGGSSGIGSGAKLNQKQYSNMQALHQSALTPTSSSPSSAVPGDLQITTGGSSSSSTQLMSSSQFDTDGQLETVDLATENLPAVDTPDACDKAALRLRCLLRLLQRGEISADVLQKNLHYAARVLEAVFIDETKSPNTDNREFNNSGQISIEKERLADEDDELSEVQPDAVPPEVREWLASTFTRQLATTRKKSDEKPKFRSVAHAIRAGIFVDRIYRRVSSTALMQFPPEVVKVLKTLDDWSFDVFALADAANGQPLKYMGYDLLNRYGIIHKFKIGPVVLETFLNRIEEGYCRYRNPYHNNLHGADVTQSMHYMLSQTGLMNWLTDLEIFATLLAAMMHDYEHTGTTNNFHVMSLSDFALLYNDRAVMENHHVSAAYRLLKDDDCNILSNLSREEFRELRTLIVDMVLSTDMSYHFQQLKNMKNLLTITDPAIDKSKALSLVLHCCDISHPAKKWSIHHRWTMLLLEEFFRQGDLERELGLPFSPLCDRNNTLVAESQIGFIDFIVDPSMSVCSDMLEYVLAPIAPMCKTANASIDEAQTGSTNSSSTVSKPTVETINEGEVSNNEPDDPNKKFRIRKPWLTILTENKKIWKEQSVKDAEARAAAAALEEKTKTEEDAVTLSIENDTTTLSATTETEITASSQTSDQGQNESTPT